MDGMAELFEFGCECLRPSLGAAWCGHGEVGK